MNGEKKNQCLQPCFRSWVTFGSVWWDTPQSLSKAELWSCSVYRWSIHRWVEWYLYWGKCIYPENVKENNELQVRSSFWRCSLRHGNVTYVCQMYQNELCSSGTCIYTVDELRWFRFKEIYEWINGKVFIAQCCLNKVHIRGKSWIFNLDTFKL